ncbi:hypothetical protein SAMN04488072_104227 [Lentibacillus halodurans]|uniref:Uncharacterized protein n=1 Tax=Lentibacillus halodurans TaxID=237679 RepID=A0A1I0X7L6_9BACI|nr:hypothetical protein [Lentibacillus halodurans]SFA97029.1 hypothetical protein SAMN04488072_104227 [Lentibacillus halodurans]
MKQVLMALFFVLIVTFSIVGYTQTYEDTEDIVDKEDRNAVILN